MEEKSKKNTTHVYTTTKVEESKALVRMSTFFVLFAILLLDIYFKAQLPDTFYLLLTGVILGVDVPTLKRKLIKKYFKGHL